MSHLQTGHQEDVLEPPSWELFGASAVFAQQFRAPQTLLSWNPLGSPGLVFLTSPIMGDLSLMQEQEWNLPGPTQEVGGSRERPGLWGQELSSACLRAPELNRGQDSAGSGSCAQEPRVPW